MKNNSQARLGHILFGISIVVLFRQVLLLIANVLALHTFGKFTHPLGEIVVPGLLPLLFIIYFYREEYGD